jgi:16S rRNA (guanine(966)-N(2))-methyltransferase RsmD
VSVPAARPRRGKAAAPARPDAAPPHEVRLIGGTWKRSKLPVPDRPGLRPTPDRVRETLFNWLGQDLTGWRCLDAFAGTGALGFEAASRGAASVLLVEADRSLATLLRATKERLAAGAVRVQLGDGVQALRDAGEAALDLALLDPPYDSRLLAGALDAAARAVAPGGFVYAEAGAPIDAWPSALEPWREMRAGHVHAVLLRRR